MLLLVSDNKLKIDNTLYKVAHHKAALFFYPFFEGALLQTAVVKMQIKLSGKNILFFFTTLYNSQNVKGCTKGYFNSS
jgi:hypothetical protein